MKRFVVICICLLPALPLQAWRQSWESIRESTSSISSIRANFVQIRRSPLLSRDVVMKGTFYYRGPGSLRWEYRSPVREVLLLREGRLTHFREQDGKLLTVESSSRYGIERVLSDVLQWMKGNFRENPHFRASLEGDTITLKASSPRVRRFMEKITLTLSSREGVISRIRILEKEGSSTTIRFTSVELNLPLDDRVFTDPEL
jgi:outer membrane lipoprotein-sorting protein